MCPEEADQDGERPHGQEFGGAAEATWFVQPGDEKAEGDLMSVYTFLMGDSEGKSAYLLCLVTSDRPGGNRMKLSQGKFRRT